MNMDFFLGNLILSNLSEYHGRMNRTCFVYTREKNFRVYTNARHIEYNIVVSNRVKKEKYFLIKYFKK